MEGGYGLSSSSPIHCPAATDHVMLVVCALDAMQVHDRLWYVGDERVRDPMHGAELLKRASRRVEVECSNT